MRAQEFVTERKKSREDFEGMTIEMVENGHVLVINALDDWGNNVLGSVAFNIHDNNVLDPQDLKVDERYQGQGIARAMYDYAKSKGYKIHRSYDQTDAGAGFWNKHRGQDVRVWEAFDNPYKTKTEKSEYGDVDVLAKLPDGTNLSIMFNHEGDNEWQVEFYRDNSQEVTGQGDAQRIFATVLAAIQKFVKKYQPDVIKFSAEKSNNSDSRSSLYDRLVSRFAQQLGYNNYSEEYMSSTMYELSKQSQGVAEQQLDELSFLGSECTKDCSGHRAGYDWSKRKGLRQANSWSPSFNKGAGLAVAGK
jgi:GNAT superfamily N-acetyltransferase